MKSRNDYICDKFQFSENLEKCSVKVPKFDIVGYRKTKSLQLFTITLLIFRVKMDTTKEQTDPFNKEATVHLIAMQRFEDKLKSFLFPTFLSLS